MSDEQLIELVKQYSLLYDITSTKYRDHNIRNAAWEEIAEQLGTTAEKCKERWQKLRNSLTSALKRRRQKSGILPWKFESHMDFLLPYMVRKKMHSPNVSIEVNDDDSAQESVSSEDDEPPRATAISPSPGSSSLRQPSLSIYHTSHTTSNQNTNGNENEDNIMKDIVDVMKTRQNKMAEMDETDHFFLFMSKQLKKLPKIDQSNIKFQMHKLLHDAEINMIRPKNY